MDPKAVEVPTATASAAVNQPASQSLTDLLESYRFDNRNLYSELRRLLAKATNTQTNPPPQAHMRRVQQLEKAFELFRQAEAKIELLVAHFGGPL
jgi:hypothetical protein